MNDLRLINTGMREKMLRIDPTSNRKFDLESYSFEVF